MSFSDREWDRIEKRLDADPRRYGMPEGGREKSLVLGSFNIRKLGKVADRKRELDFMARFCASCDLVAIQEVQDDLSGLRHLRRRTEAQVAGLPGEYGLAVSDITGTVPGRKGMAERLAFLYRNRRIRRLELASDLTFDRTAILSELLEHHHDWTTHLEEHRRKLADHARGLRKTKPRFVPSRFLTFVRSPHVVAFEALAANDQPSLTFTAVNVHLVYGKMKEREQEFEALLDWLIGRLKSGGRKMVTPNFVLLGDLNLDFDRPRVDRKRIDDQIRGLNTRHFGDTGERRVYFPFLDRHPKHRRFLRTNARASQTYDHIGFFRGAGEQRLPNDEWLDGWTPRRNPDAFEFGVFDFADLFSQTLRDKSYRGLSADEKKSLGASFEHTVSDHLPIWVRVPRPGFTL